MRLRQALKILKKIGTLRYRRGTILAACRRRRRCRHHAAQDANIVPGTQVVVRTDTAYDAEGVPVGVLPGTLGYVVELDGFPQVLCQTAVGVGVVGVPLEYLSAG